MASPQGPAGVTQSGTAGSQYYFELESSSVQFVNVSLQYVLYAGGVVLNYDGDAIGSGTATASYSVFETDSDTTFASGAVSIGTNGENVPAEFAFTSAPGSPGTLGAATQSVALITNTEYGVSLQAVTTVGWGSVGAASELVIGLDSSLYPGVSLVESSGVGNTINLSAVPQVGPSPIPAPASAWLLLSGLGVLTTLSLQQCGSTAKRQ